MAFVPRATVAVRRIAWNRRLLFPVRASSPVFRARLLAGLEGAIAQQLLPADEIDADSLTGMLRERAWVVYRMHPFAGPESVLQYLGRCTHRIVVSNDRLLELRDERVRFGWRSYTQSGSSQVVALPAREPLRRFLLHVLPSGFMRTRHCLLANRHRRAKLEPFRALLAVRPPPEPSNSSTTSSDGRSLRSPPPVLSALLSLLIVSAGNLIGLTRRLG